MQLFASVNVMLLQKTIKAKMELAPGQRQLSQRERSLLLLAEGKSTGQLIQMLGQQVQATIDELLHHGYLHLPVSAPALPDVTLPLTAHNPPETAAAPSQSLAGTRMYLFDVCERLFARRHESLAHSMRLRLREARDHHSLRDASLELLLLVEQIAGQARAASIAEQLEHLLQTTDPVRH